MENLNMNPRNNEKTTGKLGAVRALAVRALVVLVTLALIFESSPITQLAYAFEPEGDGHVTTTVDGDGAGAEQNEDTEDQSASDAQQAEDESDESDAKDSEASANDGAIAMASEQSEDEIALASEEQSDKPVSGKTYGSITYTTNTEYNGFLSSVYDAYRDSGTSLGIANSFHIVAFDTLNAPVDVYGNVLVKNLASVVDNGTSNEFVNIYGHNTLSYIQNYSGGFTRWDKSENGYVVFGSGVNITTRNNSELLLNGSRIEKPNNVVQDTDSTTTPFIDIDAVESSMTSLSATLASRSEVGASSELINEGKVRNIKIKEGYSGCAYVSLTAQDLKSSYEGINIDGLATTSGSGLVINVDCQGASSIDIPKTYLRINGQNVGIGEVDNVYGDTGYVLYNFYNTASDTSITVHECTASVLAPSATLTLGPGSACGTFIANNVNVAAESHTRPFHGNVTPSDDDDDETTSLAVNKVWKDAEGNVETDVDHAGITAELWYADESGNATEPVVDSEGNAVTAELGADNGWSHVWSDLPTKKDGVQLYYTVKESSVPSGYDSSVTPGEDGSSFTITNTRQADEDEDFSLTGYSMRAADAPVSEPDKVCYVDPKVVKVLEGRALTAGEFSFQLINDKTGEVVSTAANDEAGMVDFDKAADVSGNPDNPTCLKFSSAGTYTYTVRETPGQAKDSTVVYSTEVVKFVTVIAANADGTLYAQESYYLKYANAEDAAAGRNATKYSSDEHPTITNKVKSISLALTKTSAETGEGLEGATYALYRVDASAGTGAVQVMTATSDENGLMVFTPADASDIVVDGQYYFQEVSAPAGYTVSENKTDVFTIKMNDEGKYYLVYEDDSTSSAYSGTVADPIVFKAGTGVTDTEVQVTVGKLASDGSALAGAELAVRDASGTDVATWTTTAVGYVVKGLVSGEKYTLYEKTAPEGYAKAAEVVFTVDEYGAVTIVEGATNGDLTNAFAEGSSISLVDYKSDVREEKKVVNREEGKPSGKSGGRLAQTGDIATCAGIFFGVGACLLVGGLAHKLRRKM